MLPKPDISACSQSVKAEYPTSQQGRMKMTNSMINPKRAPEFLTVSAALVGMLLMALTACSPNYGRLQRSREVTRSFETYQILPHYKYYFSGPDSEPYAILGIHRSYELRSSLWKPVDLTTRKLKNWIYWMRDRQGFYANPYGFLILTPAGKQAGIWYSPHRTPVRFEENNGIVVRTPLPPPPHR